MSHLDSSLANETDGQRRKLKKRCQLMSVELLAIVDSVKVDKLTHKAAAKKHNVSAHLVQRLVKESKEDESFPSQIRAREEKRKLKLRLVIDHFLRHLQSKAGLTNTEQVQRSI